MWLSHLAVLAITIASGADRANSNFTIHFPSPNDPELGGITFANQAFDSTDRRYGSPYLETIYASTLFDLMGARPAKPENPAELSSRLNQLFVLKTIGKILDTEATLNGQSFEVPAERVQYAVRKILVLDSGDAARQARDDEATLFQRLRSKVGNSPFVFLVNWNEGTKTPNFDDKWLANLGSQLQDHWAPAIIVGQNPAAGLMELFPKDLEAFYRFVRKALAPQYKTMVRKRMANGWLFGYYPNRDILKPRQPSKPERFTDLFNPLSKMLINVSAEEIQRTYDELKYEVAAKPQPDFTIIEMKVGQSTIDVSSSEPMAPCALAFNKAFEKPYTEKQKEILAEMSDPSLTTSRFDELMRGARQRLPEQAFHVAKEQLAADPACAGFPVTLETIHVRWSGKKNAEDVATLSDAEAARTRFIELLSQNEALRRMMIPKLTRRDNQGNVHHYFFQTRRIEYSPVNDPRVEALLRDAITKRRLTDRMHAAASYYIKSRYAIHARTAPFSFNGVDGLQLKSAVADPTKWLAQIFVVSRMQLNPELIVERRLIERGMKTFEQAYELP